MGRESNGSTVVLRRASIQEGPDERSATLLDVSEAYLRGSVQGFPALSRWLRWWRRARVRMSTADIHNNLQQVISSPNVTLVWWVAAVELRRTGKCLAVDERDEEGAGEWGGSSETRSSALEQGPIKYNIVWAWSMIIAIPIFQLFLLVAVLVYQLTEGAPALVENLSLDTPFKNTAARVCPVWDQSEDAEFMHKFNLITKTILFCVSILKLHMMNANWRVISYLGSLKFDAVSNVLLFVASILELSGRVMFTTGCFLLLVESENVVDALLNCLALHFVIEFEDLLTQLSPRLTQSSTVALRRLCAANKHSDIALFFSVPDRKWAPYAFHRLCCWGRCVCLALRSALVGLWVLLVVLFVQSLPSCYSILMTPDAYAQQHRIPHNDMRLFRPFYETHGSSLLMALAQVADGCAYTSNPNHAEYNAGAYSYGAYWICNGYYVMPPAPPLPPPPPPPSPQAPLSPLWPYGAEYWVSPRPPPPSPPPPPGPPASPLSLSDFTELQQELAILKRQFAALNHTVASVVVCSNSCHSPGCQGVGCSLAFDGVCDDGGIGAEHNLCDPGTDCGDCGPRPVAAGASLIQP